jgi:hypothetical protein
MRNIFHLTRNNQPRNEEITTATSTTAGLAMSLTGKSEKHSDPPIFNGNPA